MGNSFENLFSDIATVIRSKDGTTALISPSSFPNRINALNVGYNSTLNITANDYSSSHYKSSCYITCTTSEGYTDTVTGTFSSSGTVSFNLKYIGTYVFHYTCLDGSTEYSLTKNIINAQNGEVYNEEVSEIDPTKSTLTEDEFIQICNAGLQSKMTIGAIITLANSYQTQWEVIGKNHDGTTNTVDIMSHTNINKMAFNSSSTNTYSGSALHTFCNSTVPNAFTNATTKSLIKTMDVVSNGSTLTGQKGKALSITEVGYSHSGALTEGTSYGLSSYLFRSGVSSYIWTRSRYPDSSSIVWYVRSSGMGSSIYYNSNGVLPVLRF